MQTDITAETEEAQMKYTINGAALTNRNAAHDEIVRALPVPEYYGRNLDALWDVVSCMEAEILVENAAAVSGYGEQVLDLFREAAEENSRLTLTIQA